MFRQAQSGTAGSLAPAGRTCHMPTSGLGADGAVGPALEELTV